MYTLSVRSRYLAVRWVSSAWAVQTISWRFLTWRKPLEGCYTRPLWLDEAAAKRAAWRAMAGLLMFMSAAMDAYLFIIIFFYIIKNFINDKYELHLTRVNGSTGEVENSIEIEYSIDKIKSTDDLLEPIKFLFDMLYVKSAELLRNSEMIAITNEFGFSPFWGSKLYPFWGSKRHY